MADAMLTPQQDEAVTWAVTQLTTGQAPVVAIRGLAGTGKTFLIPALRARLRRLGIDTSVGAPTHRATMLLRQRGVSDAETVHRLATTPYFTVDYARACVWYGQAVPCDQALTAALPDCEGLPWLVHQMVAPDLERARALRRWAGRVEAHKLLQNLGLTPQDFIERIGPKQSAGVLIIDEASMVGAELFGLCREAFPQICLVGDPGQLAPVQDQPILHAVDGYDLTEILRQVQGSPIIQLAHQARAGEPFWRALGRFGAALDAPGIVVCDAVPVTLLREAPLLVCTNATRLAMTTRIRKALGYPARQPVVGEPLVCRATTPSDRVMGFYNNGLFRISAVSAEDPRRVTVVDDLGTDATIWLHLEEVDGPEVPHKAIPFRWGYVFTAHTAQGGEWDTVLIGWPSLKRYIGDRTTEQDTDAIQRMTYTQITRAKQTLVFLMEYRFVQGEHVMAFPRKETPTMDTAQLAPPSAPMLTAPAASPPSAPMMTDPPASPLDPPDDIPEVAVPVTLQATLAQDASETAQDAPGGTQEGIPGDGALARFQGHEALLRAFCEHLQRRLDRNVLEHHKGVMEALGAVIAKTKEVLDSTTQQSEHAHYQLSDALYKLQERGVQVRHAPYTVQVHATTPQGYGVAFTATKEDAGTLLEAVQALVAWLEAQGYQASTPASWT